MGDVATNSGIRGKGEHKSQLWLRGPEHIARSLAPDVRRSEELSEDPRKNVKVSKTTGTIRKHCVP